MTQTTGAMAFLSRFRCQILPVLLMTGLLFCGIKEGICQRNHAFLAGVGTAYYYGDLTDKFNNALIRPSMHFAYQAYLNPNFSIRVEVSHSQIGASDSLGNDLARVQRNLSFRSPLTELGAVFIWELADKDFGKRWRDKGFFSPYLFAGVALFAFKPMARLGDTFYELQPLGTEGQFIGMDSYPRPYSLLQMSIPFGGGISYRFAPQFGVHLEIAYRKTFTDYLDDVSTFYPDPTALMDASGPISLQLSNQSNGIYEAGDKRGNPNAKDSYFFTTLGLVWYLKNRY